jgi:hypothetical protein
MIKKQLFRYPQTEEKTLEAGKELLDNHYTYHVMLAQLRFLGF